MPHPKCDAIAIIMPELGRRSGTMKLSAWLVWPGEPVFEGDRLVEILTEGATFDVPAPASGEIIRVEIIPGQEVQPGMTLGWMKSE